MLNFNFGNDLDPKFIPRLIPWGWTGDEPYLWVKLPHIWFDLNFLAKNKIGTPKFYFGDNLDSKFIPRRIPWGWTLFICEIGPDLVLQKYKIWMTNSYSMDNLDPKIHPRKDFLGINLVWTIFKGQNCLYFVVPISIKKVWWFSSLLAHSYYIKTIA